MLLRDAGYDIEVSPADVEEHHRSDESPRAYVSRLAVDKVVAVAQRYPEQIVIGADTVVVDPESNIPSCPICPTIIGLFDV